MEWNRTVIDKFLIDQSILSLKESDRKRKRRPQVRADPIRDSATDTKKP